jgi:TPR repeat protein
VSLPPATILSVPIYDLAKANEEVAKMGSEEYHPCCGKTICGGCIHSFCESGTIGKCPFCNADRCSKTEQDAVEEMMKRVEANDASSISVLAQHYQHGLRGVEQDHAKAMNLFNRAAELGYSKAHNNLAGIYYEGGNVKKAKFHCEAAAMAGLEVSRYNLGVMESQSGNMERAVKHWTIGASAGCYDAMQHLRLYFEQRHVSRELIDSTLEAYNNSCAKMRSEARDACIRAKLETI